MAQLIKNPPAMWETWVLSLDQDDSLGKGTATHSSIWPGGFSGLDYTVRGVTKELDTTERLSLSKIRFVSYSDLYDSDLIEKELSSCFDRKYAYLEKKISASEFV